MGGVLPYKWEAYCRVSLSSKLRSQESIAIQMGGVLPYKLEVYCRTFSETGRGWGFRNIAQIISTLRSSCRIADNCGATTFVVLHNQAECFRDIINCQRRKSAQGILRLWNPNLGPNSGKRILDARILDPNSWVKFFDSVFPAKEAP